MYKTNFNGIELKDTWLDRAINLETSTNIFSKLQEKELDMHTSPGGCRTQEDGGAACYVY